MKEKNPFTLKESVDKDKGENQEQELLGGEREEHEYNAPVNLDTLNSWEKSYLAELEKEAKLESQRMKKDKVIELIEEDEVNQAYDRFCQQYLKEEVESTQSKYTYQKIIVAACIGLFFTGGLITTVYGVREKGKVEVNKEVGASSYYAGEQLVHEHAEDENTKQFFAQLDELEYFQEEEMLVLDGMMVNSWFNRGVIGNEELSMISRLDMIYFMQEVEIYQTISYNIGEFIREEQKLDYIEQFETNEYEIKLYHEDGISTAIIESEHYYYKFFGACTIEEFKDILGTMYRR